MLISKVDNAWFVGYLENDVMQQGLFPVQFVDIIVNLKEETPSQKVRKLTSVTSELARLWGVHKSRLGTNLSNISVNMNINIKIKIKININT